MGSGSERGTKLKPKSIFGGDGGGFWVSGVNSLFMEVRVSDQVCFHLLHLLMSSFIDLGFSSLQIASYAIWFKMKLRWDVGSVGVVLGFTLQTPSFSSSFSFSS